MTIVDINGSTIEVVDLKDAIKQAKFFKDCHHVPPTPYDEKMHQYWSHLYQKLCELKNSLSNKSK